MTHSSPRYKFKALLRLYFLKRTLSLRAIGISRRLSLSLSHTKNLTMPLELRPLAKEDAQEAVALSTASYKNNGFITIALPNGMSQASIDKLVEKRQKAVDDPDKYAFKVVDTDNNDKMAGFAVWEYTKAMTDEDWERAREEAPKAYPEARHDIVDQFILMEQEFKRKVMGHTRWFGQSSPALDVLSLNGQQIYLSTAEDSCQ